MPSSLEAILSGWKGSRALIFSPVPMNLIGLPVMALVDRAAPPRASPSTLVSMMPVNGRASLKALAVLAASWPVMLSTTNRVSVGLRVWVSCLISCIISWSMWSRPRKSRKTS